MEPLVWKVLGTGSAVLAGVVANKVVTAAWRRSGRDDGIDPNNPEVPIGQAIAFAALTGLAVGLTRVFATRAAAQAYRRASGHLPPVMTPRY